eukprot:gene8418-9106_t
MAICFWFNLGSQSSIGSFIIDKSSRIGPGQYSGGWGVTYDGTGIGSFFISGSTTVSSVSSLPIFPNVWNHFCVCKLFSTYFVYFNGANAGSGSLPSKIVRGNGNAALVVGASNRGNNYPNVFATIFDKSWQAASGTIIAGYTIMQYASTANRYIFYFKSSTLAVSCSESTLTAILTSNQWSHFVVAKKRNNIVVYINAVVACICTLPYSDVMSNGALPFVIGAKNKGQSIPATGPTIAPTLLPTLALLLSSQPSNEASVSTVTPSSLSEFSLSPTLHPSLYPSFQPSLQPSLHPSPDPTFSISVHPSDSSTFHPTLEVNSLSSLPSQVPSTHPSVSSTISPTTLPSATPSISPTNDDTPTPVTAPPISLPSLVPSIIPSIAHPSNIPSLCPSQTPSFAPTLLPSPLPTLSPTSGSYQSLDEGTRFIITAVGSVEISGGRRNSRRIFTIYPLSSSTVSSTVQERRRLGQFIASPTMTLSQTITITDFRLKYDVIDVVRFPSYEKVGDLSYSTNPLIIYLRDDKQQRVIFPSIRTMDLTESNFYFKSSDDNSSSSKSLLTMDSAVITSIVLLGMFVLLAGLSARLRAEKHAKEEKEEANRVLLKQQRENEIEGMVVDVPFVPSALSDVPQDVFQKLPNLEVDSLDTVPDIASAPFPRSSSPSSHLSSHYRFSSEEEPTNFSDESAPLMPNLAPSDSSSSSKLSIETTFVSRRITEDFDEDDFEEDDDDFDVFNLVDSEK